VHVVGLSILSGSHMPLVNDVVSRLRAAGLDDVPVVVGGIIPPGDAAALKKSGVAAVYTPKDFELNRMMSDVLRILETQCVARIGPPGPAGAIAPARGRTRGPADG
jgi:ethylmalonyl-CoA mutase